MLPAVVRIITRRIRLAEIAGVSQAGGRGFLEAGVILSIGLNYVGLARNQLSET
jgi:hypothetical protein